MRAELLTLPLAEPVTVNEITAHCRIPGEVAAEEATVIQSFISAAREYVETMVGYELAKKSWRLYYDSFDELLISKFPIITLDAFKYYSDGVLTVVDPDLYQFFPFTYGPSYIYPLDDIDWPEYDEVSGAVQIDVTTGYNDYTKMPNTLKVAIKLLAADWFEHREDTYERKLQNIPNGVMRLVKSNRLGTYP